MACRVASHRKRRRPISRLTWFGKVPKPRRVRRDLADRLIELAKEDGGAPKTGRRFYYLALSHGYITPDMDASKKAKASRDAAYKAVTSALALLRKDGRIAWNAVLDLTRELDTPLAYGSTRDARANICEIYDEDRWIGQPNYPLLIVEKDTMQPVCKPIAQRWRMPFASSRGYGSLTLQHDVAEMLRRRYLQTEQEAIIYFVSDLDPSGLDLQRSWEEALTGFGIYHATVERIGLTAEQITDHALEGFAIAVKPSDSRAKSYIESYGDQCWEADVLPAEVIEDAINTDIMSWLNRKLWKQREAEIERARKLL